MNACIYHIGVRLLFTFLVAVAIELPAQQQPSPPAAPNIDGMDAKMGIPFPNYFLLKSHIQSPLLRAIMEGNTVGAVAMIKSGSNTTFTVKGGVTPLMVACSMGQTSVVNQLIIRRSLLDTTDDQKMTALMYAGLQGRGAIMRDLLRAGARVDLADAQGRTALICAVIGGNSEAIDEMLSRDNRIINFKDNQGSTALHIAARLGDTKTAELLMAWKADPLLKNNAGFTPLDYADLGRNALLQERLGHYTREYKK